MMDYDAKQAIKERFQGYVPYSQYEKEITFIIKIPCTNCEGKGHNQNNFILDQNKSLSEIRCENCEGEGYKPVPFSLDEFGEMIEIIMEHDEKIRRNITQFILTDYDIQNSIIELIKNISGEIIEALKDGVVSSVMET